MGAKMPKRQFKTGNEIFNFIEDYMLGLKHKRYSSYLRSMLRNVLKSNINESSQQIFKKCSFICDESNNKPMEWGTSTTITVDFNFNDEENNRRHFRFIVGKEGDDNIKIEDLTAW